MWNHSHNFSCVIQHQYTWLHYPLTIPPVSRPITNVIIQKKFPSECIKPTIIPLPQATIRRLGLTHNHSICNIACVQKLDGDVVHLFAVVIYRGFKLPVSRNRLVYWYGCSASPLLTLTAMQTRKQNQHVHWRFQLLSRKTISSRN